MPRVTSPARVWLRRTTLGLAALFLVSQLIPVDRHNPPVDASHSIDAAEKVPAPVQGVFHRSCRNCHSDETSWPWYSYVAPISWMIANDVHNARKKMNLSEWGTYSAKKREEKLEDICEQVTDGDMPDAMYAFFHREARVTPQERTAICQWTEDSRQY